MQTYSLKVKNMMLRLYQSLNERDRRRYAAIESIKLGHGGIQYVSQILKCDPKTIHVGLRELDIPDEVEIVPDLEISRQRKKGLDANP